MPTQIKTIFANLSQERTQEKIITYYIAILIFIVFSLFIYAELTDDSIQKQEISQKQIIQTYTNE